MERLYVYCDICDKMVPDLMIHFQLIHLRGSLLCPFCGIQCSSCVSQYNHIHAFHAREIGYVFVKKNPTSTQTSGFRGNEIIQMMNQHLFIEPLPLPALPSKKRFMNEVTDMIGRNNFAVIYHEGWLVPLVGCHSKTLADLEVVVNPDRSSIVFVNDPTVPVRQVSTSQWICSRAGLNKFHVVSANMNRLNMSDYMDTFKSFNVFLTMGPVNRGFMAQMDNQISRLLIEGRWDRVDAFVGCIPKTGRGIQVDVGQFMKDPAHVWALLVLNREGGAPPLIQAFICQNNLELDSIWSKRTSLTTIEELAGERIFSEETKKLTYSWDFEMDVYRCRSNGCFFSFEIEEMLREHYAKVHPTTTCILCCETFSNKKELQQHNRMKHFKHECEICGAKFGRKYHLLTHLFTHSDQKNFKCESPGCGKEFKTKNYLSDHIKTKHTKREGHKCPYCFRVIKDRGNFRKHIKNLHPESYKKWQTQMDQAKSDAKFLEPVYQKRVVFTAVDSSSSKSSTSKPSQAALQDVVQSTSSNCINPWTLSSRSVTLSTANNSQKKKTSSSSKQSKRSTSKISSNKGQLSISQFTRKL